MPNYIKNRLTIKGEQEVINKMLEKFSTQFEKTPNLSYGGEVVYQTKGDGYKIGWLNKETGVFSQRGEDDTTIIPDGFEIDFNEAWTRFPDFNKVIPRPESLDIESGGHGSMGYSIIKNNSDNQFMTMAEMTQRFYNNDEETRVKILELGINYVKNENEHGFKNWYDWSIAKWGTKWNSSECEQIKENTYDFTTAWSGVPKLIELIANSFKQLEIVYEWSDEDTGCNCGRFTYNDGISIGSKLENESKEAYDLAFKLRPENKEYYSLVDGKYEYVEED